MAINTQELFDVIAEKYGATGENDSFLRWFFIALGRIEQDLKSPRVGVTVVMPEDLETDIELSDDYLTVVMDGLNKYIQESGNWGNDEVNVLDGRYARSIGRAQTTYSATQTVYTRTSGA